MNIRIDAEQVRLLLKDAVREAVQEELPKLVRQALRKEYLTREEIKALTGFSDRKLQYLRSSNQIEFVKNGNSVLYRTDEVEAFMERHKIRPRGHSPDSGKS